MPNPKYDIVFEGRFVEGADPVRVRSLIGQILKVDRENARQLFSGRRIVIKRGVDLPEAQRFKNLMRKAGAACRLVPQNVTLTDSRATDPMGPPQPPPTAPVRESVGHETKRDIETEGRTKQDSRLTRRNPGRALRHWCSNLAQMGSDLVTRFQRKGKGRSRKLPVLFTALAACAAIGLAALKQTDGPMPADEATLERFTAGFNATLLEVETGRSRAVTHVHVAKAVIEDMGYDYDETLLCWRFNRALSRDARRRKIRDDYLIGPLKILFELDAGRLKSLLAPETYAALEETLDIGEHITLRSILMLRECARGAIRVPHEALVAGLQKFDVPVDPHFPEISVEEAFFGLSHHGLVQIHKRREWKTKRVELEILDRALIDDQERKLQRLERMHAQYTQNL